MRRVFVSILSLYQYLISPLYSPCCRFTPSCSEYARQAVLSHGILRGDGSCPLASGALSSPVCRRLRPGSLP